MKTCGEIQHFTNLIYNTQFQKVNVLSILKDISKMLEDPEVKEEKRTIRNSHSNLEIIFGKVLLIVCLEKETKGGTIKLFLFLVLYCSSPNAILLFW
jgi:hypothetical protein